MSDLASSRPVPDEPPDPRPGGPADVSGLFPSSSELYVPAAREPSDPDELALSPLAEVIADLADLRSPDPDQSSPRSDMSDFSSFSDEFRHFSPSVARPHPRDVHDFDPIDAVTSGSEDAEPTARSIAALLSSPATSAAELADAVAWCYDDAALPLLLPLAHHPDAGVRRAVAQALPSVLGEAPPDDTIHALILLSADRDNDVRDWACFALGTQLSELDSTTVRNALAARLDDPHDDTRCEALLGLARRRDTRVLPVLHERLARDNVYSLEIDAAGALGHASLHTLVRGHLSGWDDDVVARVCAALRLTDPDGVGDDLLDGLADWFRAGAPHASDEDRYWWSVTLQLLEHAEYRAPEIAEQVHYRLQSAEPATALMLGSRLSQLAGDHGWPRWRPSH
ncbi:HEAT repeat domain-containing protein [Dactylosporangium sp. CA-139114]|uniref:HEAT repeat domain-containing protein n=1 Tax=Dactylosporangium sp. CA-139114 TaxID=3239931 RepID=UPI003D95998A